MNLVEQRGQVHGERRHDRGVACDAEAGDAVLRVRDDGVGMSPELAARVFDLFVQGDAALDRAPGGLGIGLTLVRRLAELHGGTRRGARATGPGRAASSPCACRRSRRGARPRPLRAAGTARRTPRATCSWSRTTTTRARRSCSCSSSAATACARRATARRRSRARSRAPPEIALVDIGLPGIDGYEVARRLRARGRSPRSRWSRSPATACPRIAQRALDAGFDVHLVKPVDLAALQAVLAG